MITNALNAKLKQPIVSGAFIPKKQPPAGSAVAGTQTGTGLNGTPTFTGTGASGSTQVDPNQRATGTVAPNTPTGNDAATNAAPKSFEQQSEDFISSLMQGAGNPDTSAQDAMIQQQEAAKEGKDVVNQRASMGRAGFGASGAMGAMEGDVRRKDSAQAAQDQLTYDTQQKQQSINNASNALTLDAQTKQAAMDQAMQQEIMKMIAANDQPTPTPTPTPDAGGGGGGGGTVAGNPSLGQIANGVIQNSGLMPTKPPTLASAGQNAPKTAPKKVTKDQLPPGSKPDGKEGNITYYKGPDGTEYYVVG